MNPVALAVLTGLFLALASLYIRWGLERGTAGAAVLVVNFVSAVLAWPMFFLLSSWSEVSNWAVVTFIAAGFTGLFLGRLLLFAGMKKVGLSVSTPLYNIQAPLSVMGGAFLFSEALTPLIGFGTATAVGGVSLLCLSRLGPRADHRIRLKDLALPLGSGACVAASQLLRKWGLEITPDIYFGLAIMASTSFLCSLATVVIWKQPISVPRGRPLNMFVMAGVMTNIAHLTGLAAILGGDLVVVIPLQNTEMIFALLLSVLFLRGLERVTLAVVTGAALVMAGAVMVNF